MKSLLNIKTLFGAIMCWLMHLALYSQELPHAQATLDTNFILIGEQAKLHLSVTYPAQDTLKWPAKSDTLTSDIEIVEQSKIDTAFDKEQITQKTLSQTFTITAFDSGYFAIPPFQFAVNGDTIETEPLLLSVQTVQVDTAKKAIADIKAPLSVEYTFIDWLKDNWPWVAGGIAVIVIILLLVYLFRKRSKEKPEPVIKPQPKRPAHEIALEELNTLKDKKLWQNNKVKLFHIHLSEIMREYLENRYHFNAPEQTTEEIMQHLRSMDIDAESKERLKQLLTLSDLVKFAKEKPIATENERSLQNAFDIVEQTKQLPVSNKESTETEINKPPA